VVSGLKSSTLISACLLLIALGLACLVHREPHAREHARNGARPAGISD